MSEEREVVFTLEHNAERRRGFSGRLTVNGVDLSSMCSEINIKAPAQQLPQVTITLSPMVLRVELPADVKMLLPDDIGLALRSET
jgi:hypothetical protein